jgi:hypothetical protein
MMIYGFELACFRNENHEKIKRHGEAGARLLAL